MNEDDDLKLSDAEKFPPAPYGQGDDEDVELTGLEGIIQHSHRRKK